MTTPFKTRSLASPRPVAVLLGAAIVPAMLGCGPSAWRLTYSGTASLQTSEVAAPELGSIGINVVPCAAEVNERGEVVDQVHTFLELGDGCVIPLTADGARLVGTSGGRCTVRIGGQSHALRVTDTLLTYAVAGRYRSVDAAIATVRVGADEDDDRGHAHHVLLSFQGGLRAVTDADAWCRATAQEFRRPPPPPPEVEPRPPFGRF